MKKFTKLFGMFAFVLIVPILLAGCDLSSLLGGGGDPEVSSIEIHTPFKTEYSYKENLDVSNGLLTVIYDDGTENQIIINESMISNFNNEIPGSKTMLVTYKNKTCTVNYTVEGFKPSSNALFYGFLLYYYDYSSEQNIYMLFRKIGGEENKYNLYNYYSSTSSPAIAYNEILNNLPEPNDINKNIHLEKEDYYWCIKFYQNPGWEVVFTIKFLNSEDASMKAIITETQEVMEEAEFKIYVPQN